MSWFCIDLASVFPCVFDVLPLLVDEAELEGNHQLLILRVLCASPPLPPERAPERTHARARAHSHARTHALNSTCTHSAWLRAARPHDLPAYASRVVREPAANAMCRHARFDCSAQISRSGFGWLSFHDRDLGGSVFTIGIWVAQFSRSEFGWLRRCDANVRREGRGRRRGTEEAVSARTHTHTHTRWCCMDLWNDLFCFSKRFF
eukprot:1989009-Pleurochrysis_carterae.AAC.2